VWLRPSGASTSAGIVGPLAYIGDALPLKHHMGGEQAVHLFYLGGKQGAVPALVGVGQCRKHHHPGGGGVRGQMGGPQPLGWALSHMVGCPLETRLGGQVDDVPERVPLLLRGRTTGLLGGGCTSPLRWPRGGVGGIALVHSILVWHLRPKTRE